MYLHHYLDKYTLDRNCYNCYIFLLMESECNLTNGINVFYQIYILKHIYQNCLFI